MAPLILHNVPDEELYVGDDGIQRPYAMVFPQLVPAYAIHFCLFVVFSPWIRLTLTFLCKQSGRSVRALEESSSGDWLLWQVDAAIEIQNRNSGEERRPNSCSRRPSLFGLVGRPKHQRARYHYPAPDNILVRRPRGDTVLPTDFPPKPANRSDN